MAAGARTAATLRWPEVEKGEKYLLEIYGDRGLKRLILKEEIKEASYRWKNPLPGFYWFRVAVFDRFGRLSEFSHARRIKIKPLPPAAHDELKDSLVEYYGRKPEIDLKWTGVSDKYASALIISKDKNFKGPGIKKKLKEYHYKFIPPGPGEYFWKVRFISGKVKSNFSPVYKIKVMKLKEPKISKEINGSYVSAGIGPYMISDSISPKDFHLLMLNIKLQKEIKSFLPPVSGIFNLNSKNFIMGLDLIASQSLLGPDESGQKIYYLSGQLGYKLNFTGFEITPGIGYMVYYSNDNYYRGNELLDLTYQATAGANILLKKRLLNKLFIRAAINFVPYMGMQVSDYGFRSDFDIIYPLKMKKILFIKYIKNTFCYSYAVQEKQVIENIDAVMVGYGAAF